MEVSLLSSYSFALLVVALVTVALTKVIIVVHKQRTFWKKKGVPYIKAFPLFGSGWKVLLRRISFVDYGLQLYNCYPDAKYIGLMDFATPVVVLRDPELIKDITVKNFEHFTDHRSFITEEMDPIFGKNVFSLRGERWKEMRNTLSPSFTASKMRFMFDLVSKCAHEFVDYLYDHPEFSAEMETKDAFTRYTTDVIATAAFGIGVNSLKDRKNEFFVRGTEVSAFGSVSAMIRFILFRLSPRLAKLMGLKFLSRDANRFFNNIVYETVSLREKKGIVRPDMIHLLMQARENEKCELTIEDMVAQAFIFFLAGFDTSSTLMCCLVHELAVNPDIQEKLRNEVETYIAEGNGEITYEALAKMEYMEMVISEALRKYPPVIFIDRECVQRYKLPPVEPGGEEVVIEKGDLVWIPAYAMQNDPKYFPDPKKFDPERFSEANKDSIIPYSYTPFGHGPRKCIGNRFALMETKLLIGYLLHKFNVKISKKTQIPLDFSKSSFTLNAEGGFWVNLEKRNV